MTEEPKKPEPGVVLRAALKCISPDNLKGSIPAKQVYELVDVVTNNLLDIHRKLEQRVAQLEARPSLHEAGIWTDGKNYGAGAVVTDHGSAWVAKRETTRRPGESNDDWRLLVKKGRDGKDAR